MLEWLKRHAWKACIRQKRIPSSNLGHSAKKDDNCRPFLYHENKKYKRYNLHLGCCFKNNWNNLDNYLIDGQLFELFQLSIWFSCDVVV